MSCSWLVSVIFGQLLLHSLSRPLFHKWKNSSTKWQFLWKIEVNHPSFNDLAISSQHLLRLFAVLSIHLFISVSHPHSFTMHAVSLSICQSKTQLQKAFSPNAGARTLTLTTSKGICRSADATKRVTSPAAHRDIWHGAGVTKSWLHSPAVKKLFAVIRKVSTQPKFFIHRIRQMFRDDIWIGIGDTKKINSDAWKHMVRVPVNSSSLNLSLFLAFPSYSNADSGRCWFTVVQYWRIPPQNDHLLEEWSSRREEPFFPCTMAWFALQCWLFAQTLGCFVFSPLPIPASLPQSKIRLQKAFSPDAGALSLWHSLPQSGVYGRVRVPRNLDSLFFNCPVLDHFPSDFYFSRWGWGWVHISSSESMLRRMIVWDGTWSIHHQASFDFSSEDRFNT